MKIEVQQNSDNTYYIGIEENPGFIIEDESRIANMMGMGVSEYKRMLCTKFNAKRMKNEDGEAIIYFDNTKDAQNAIDNFIVPKLNSQTIAISKSRLLKKHALGRFKESELKFVEDIISFLNSKRNRLADMANRSSNFDEPFNLIYDQLILQLESAIEIEREDNREEDANMFRNL